LTPVTSGPAVAAKAPDGKAVRTAPEQATVAEVFRMERREYRSWVALEYDEA
jgi:hypothetical protein